MTISGNMQRILSSWPTAVLLKDRTFSLTQGNKITLLPTPGLWGADPTQNNYWRADGRVTESAPTAACQKLCKAITDVIGSAKQVVDITMLWHTNVGLPDGYFFDAIRDGLKRLHDQGSRPLVRILCGVPPPVMVANGDLEKWLRAILPPGSPLSVFMATNHTRTAASWNHSKIVAADGVSAIVGGHNLWSNAYLSYAPVHDISALIEGPAARTAHAFCDLLWSHRGSPLAHVHLMNGKLTYEEPPPASLPPPPKEAPGAAEMMALGRLGSGIVNLDPVGDAGVTARLIAILCATSRIRIIQQGLGFSLMEANDSSWDHPTMRALAKMIVKGVKVDIIMSNDNARDGTSDPYCGPTLKDTWVALARFVEAERMRPAPASDHPLEYVHRQCPYLPPIPSGPTWDLVKERVHLMPLRFSNSGYVWKSPGRPDRIAGLHAKVYQIDDQGFYVGSDNMYRSGSDAGLQEFGYFVDSQEETRKFQRAYWDPLYSYSINARIT